MRPLMKGNVVQNSNIYKFMKCHADSWRQGPMVDWMWNDSNQVKDGIDLSEEQIWAIALNTAPAAYRQFTFAVVQKDIFIASNGSVQVM